MKLIILLITALALVGFVSAQDSREVSSKDRYYPAQVDNTKEQCYELQVNSLYAATDLSLSLEEQEKRINAARIYSTLAEMGLPC